MLTAFVTLNPRLREYHGMQINHPDVVAELAVASENYDTALVENNVSTLEELFWVSSYVVRYGATENLYGADEISAFRAARPSSGLSRRVTQKVITTFGTDFGTTSLQFTRDSDTRVGRQTQSWVRMEEGWRIVAAHVSWMDS